MHTSNKTVYKGAGCGQSSKRVHVNVICTAVCNVTFFKIPPLSHEEGYVNKARRSGGNVNQMQVSIDSNSNTMIIGCFDTVGNLADLSKYVDILKYIRMDGYPLLYS